jgi:Gram-negative bacterial TonB protein C-terminal
MKFASLFRLALLFALTAIIVSASQQKQVPNCCTSKTEKLSPRQVKSRVLKTEPMQLGGRVHIIDNIVVLAVEVDDVGKVACLNVISGHPMLVGSALDSVKRWRFRPYVLRGRSEGFCGRIALRITGNDQGLKYDVIEASPN